MNKIPVYKQEKLDGIADRILTSGSVKSYSKIIPAIPFLANKVALATHLGQEDLYYFKSILVSTVWNLNDDIFLPVETWLAKESVPDKPINFSHIPNEILGHMTDASPVDKEFIDIPLDTAIDSLPDIFHLMDYGVFYKHLGVEELKAKMDNIIAEVEAGKWFVSMEALFTNFDYGLRNDKTGENKIIARGKDSAFLTKYLRSYGGEGVYDGNRIGRVLRNLVFCGKGIVEQPANPSSIIFAKSDIFTALVYSDINEINFGEKKKMEELELKIKEVEATLKTEQERVAALLSEKQTHEAAILGLQENVAKLEKEKVNANRISQVIDSLALTKEEAKLWVDNLSDLSEAKFSAAVEQMKIKLAKPPVVIPVVSEAKATVIQAVEDALVQEPALNVNDENLGEQLYKDIAKFFDKGDK